jgi:putative Mg2+ transporter-C (MgtC) family protein
MAIGIERQWHQKMAGLRTNVLVAVGSAGFVAYSATAVTQADPTRMAAQIISGIGFLGAGVIMREGLTVHGLNTAATLWCSAAVGTFAGGGSPIGAAITSVFIVGANICFRPLGNLIDRNVHSTAEIEVKYGLTLTAPETEGARLRERLIGQCGKAGLGLLSLKTAPTARPGEIDIIAAVVSHRRDDALLERITGALAEEPAVTGVSWQNAGGRLVD